MLQHILKLLQVGKCSPSINAVLQKLLLAFMRNLDKKYPKMYVLHASQVFEHSICMKGHKKVTNSWRKTQSDYWKYVYLNGTQQCLLP